MNEKEIYSLIKLLDDPDMEIFSHVEDQLSKLGPSVIGLLEKQWEQSFDALEQVRIENLIHKIQYKEVMGDLIRWEHEGAYDLMKGLLIINRYQYPTINEEKLREQLDEMVQLIKEENVDELSPEDAISTINNVFYYKLGFSGNTSNYHDPQNSFLSQVLETRKGNPLLLSCIYLLLAEKLRLPIYGINLPKHFVLAYASQFGQLLVVQEDILFYINAFNGGQIISYGDVLSYLRQLNLPIDEQYLTPCSNLDIIIRLLNNLHTAYEKLGQEEKALEVLQLLSAIKQH